jgi:hypothetical protein
MVTIVELIRRTIDPREVWPLREGLQVSDVSLFYEMIERNNYIVDKETTLKCIHDLAWKMYYDSARSKQLGIMNRAIELEPKLQFLRDVHELGWMIVGEFAAYLAGYRNGYKAIEIIFASDVSALLRNFEEKTKRMWVKDDADYIFAYKKKIWDKMFDVHRSPCSMGIVANDYLYDFKPLFGTNSTGPAKTQRDYNNPHSLQHLCCATVLRKLIKADTKNRVKLTPETNQELYNCYDMIPIKDKKSIASVVKDGCKKSSTAQKCVDRICTLLNINFEKLQFVPSEVCKLIHGLVWVYKNDEKVAIIIDFKKRRSIIIVKVTDNYVVENIS